MKERAERPRSRQPQQKRKEPASVEQQPAPKEFAEQGLHGSSGLLPYIDKLEASFQRPLGHIQAHTGKEAQEASFSLGAKAYATQGRVVLGQGCDLKTVAEETAHALQQRPTIANWHQTSGLTDPSGGLETDAQLAASNVAMGRPASVSLGAGPGVIARSSLGDAILGLEKKEKQDLDTTPKPEQKPDSPVITPDSDVVQPEEEPETLEPDIEEDKPPKKIVDKEDDDLQNVEKPPADPKPKKKEEDEEKDPFMFNQVDDLQLQAKYRPLDAIRHHDQIERKKRINKKKEKENLGSIRNTCVFDESNPLCTMGRNLEQDYVDPLHKTIFGEDRLTRNKSSRLDGLTTLGFNVGMDVIPFGKLGKGLLKGGKRLLSEGTEGLIKGVTKTEGSLVKQGSKKGLKNLSTELGETETKKVTQSLTKDGTETLTQNLGSPPPMSRLPEQQFTSPGGKRKLVRDLERQYPNSPHMTKVKELQSPQITKPYKRPPRSTVPKQKKSVQGKRCITCGKKNKKMHADHKKPLVKEYYENGKIDLKKMRDVKSVQPQCPTCSHRQGGKMSGYSKKKKKELGLKRKK